MEEKIMIPKKITAINALPPILVTGSHRSGTTWVGAVLNAAPRTRIVFEPFNIQLRSKSRRFDPRCWYLQVDPECCESIRADIASTLSDYAYWQSAVPMHFGFRRLAKFALRRSEYFLQRSRRVIYKDPLAFFSAEWLATNFDMRPVITVRHPRAFVSSLLVKGWNFDFENLRDQPLLMQTIEPFRDQITAYARKRPDIVDQGILLWNVIYHRASEYRARHADWLFVRHEDLSLDPSAGFESLFKALDLQFGPAQKRYIEELCGSHNPSGQSGFGVRLNSRANLNQWKKRLTNAQVARIEEGTKDIRRMFYTDVECASVEYAMRA